MPEAPQCPGFCFLAKLFSFFFGKGVKQFSLTAVIDLSCEFMQYSE
jgi:hypothetical protein